MSVRDEKAVPYLNDRILVKREGYSVIFSSDQTIPLCCPVCTVVMRSKIDEEEYKKNSCCSDCAKTWAYPNIIEWKNGWRPTQSEIISRETATTEFVLKFD